MIANIGPSFQAYCDSDWVRCHTSRQSLNDYTIKFVASLVSWKCKNQNIISQSSAEAEHMCMTTTWNEVTWSLNLSHTFGFYNSLLSLCFVITSPSYILLPILSSVRELSI